MLRLGTGRGYFRFRSQRFPALLLRLGTDMGFFRFRSQRFPALLMRLGTEAFLSEKSSTFLISFCRLFLEISCVYPILLSCLQIYGEQFVKIQLLYPNDLKSCGSNYEKNSFCTQPLHMWFTNFKKHSFCTQTNHLNWYLYNGHAGLGFSPI